MADRVESLLARGAETALLLLATLVAVPSVADDVESDERTLEVTATAYNSVPSQTSEDPRVAAWGDQLEPGMKVIAVSRDLIDLGLSHGVEVEILGLSGSYVVLDKMARHWRRKIDIYMGEDVEAALRWGRRTVTIRWRED